MMINLYAHEQLMVQRQREIANSARHAWKFVTLLHKPNRTEGKPAPAMAVQPAADCCSVCCTA